MKPKHSPSTGRRHARSKRRIAPKTEPRDRGKKSVFDVSERGALDASELAKDSPLDEVFSGSPLDELLDSDVPLTELLTGERTHTPRGNPMKRAQDETSTASAAHPAASFGPDTIESLAQAVADRVADRIADRLAGLVGQSAPQPAAGETIGWPPGRLTVTEPEAAALLGMRRHQLRDRRLKGAIRCSSAEGARPVLYTRENLLQFINRAGGTVSKPTWHEPSDTAPNNTEA